jgi:hypothetical protein
MCASFIYIACTRHLHFPSECIVVVLGTQTRTMWTLTEPCCRIHTPNNQMCPALPATRKTSGSFLAFVSRCVVCRNQEANSVCPSALQHSVINCAWVCTCSAVQHVSVLYPCCLHSWQQGMDPQHQLHKPVSVTSCLLQSCYTDTLASLGQANITTTSGAITIHESHRSLQELRKGIEIMGSFWCHGG